MKITLIAALLLSGTLMFLETAAAENPKLVYTADSYDPKRDAYEDLEASKVIAERDGRHILLLVGGDWCPWCRKPIYLGRGIMHSLEFSSTRYI